MSICRHSSHAALLRQAVLCALDLADTPSNAETKVVFLKVELKSDHAKLPAIEIYRVVGGFDLTRRKACEILPPGGAAVLDTGIASHEYIKKKGGLGVAQLILGAHGFVDVISINLPSHEGAKKAIAAANWGRDWVYHARSSFTVYYCSNSFAQVAHLQMALEVGYTASFLS